MCVTRLPNGVRLQPFSATTLHRLSFGFCTFWGVSEGGYSQAVRKKKGYRMQIITMVPWLKMLDATTVTPKEGEDAVVHQQQVKKERTFLSPERLRRIRVASPTRRMWGSDVKDTREPETSAVGKSMSSISIAEYTDGGGV